MQIHDSHLTLGAAALELCIPVAAAIALVRRSPWRNFAAALLGAVTPLLLVYADAIGSYFFAATTPSGMFAVNSVWVMTFPVFAAAMLLAALLAISRRPSSLYVRYFVGLLTGPVSYGLLNVVSWAYRFS